MRFGAFAFANLAHEEAYRWRNMPTTIYKSSSNDITIVKHLHLLSNDKLFDCFVQIECEYLPTLTSFYTVKSTIPGRLVVEHFSSTSERAHFSWKHTYTKINPKQKWFPKVNSPLSSSDMTGKESIISSSFTVCHCEFRLVRLFSSTS